MNQKNIIKIIILLLFSFSVSFCKGKKETNLSNLVNLLALLEDSDDDKDKIVLFQTSLAKKEDGTDDDTKRVIRWIEREGKNDYIFESNKSITISPTSGINLLEYDKHLFISNCLAGQKEQELIIYSLEDLKKTVKNFKIKNNINECAEDLVIIDDEAYIIMQNSKDVLRIDVSNKKEPKINNKTITVEYMPKYIESFKNHLYVVNQDSNKIQSTISKIDIEEDEVITTFNVGDNPNKITFFSGDTSIWTLNTGFSGTTNRSSSISYIDKNGFVGLIQKPDIDRDKKKENIESFDFNDKTGYAILKDVDDGKGKLVEMYTTGKTFAIKPIKPENDYKNLIQNRKQGLFFKIYTDSSGKNKIDIEDLDGDKIQTLDVLETSGWRNAK